MTGDINLYARWAHNGINITTATSTTSTWGGDTNSVTVTATFKDGNGNPLQGITVDIESLYKSWGSAAHLGLKTDAVVKSVKHTVSLDGAGDRSMNIIYCC